MSHSKRRKLETSADNNNGSSSSEEEWSWSSSDERETSSTIRAGEKRQRYEMTMTTMADTVDSSSITLDKLLESPTLLRIVFSFATYQQLALQVPLVCKTWQRVSYSDTCLWRTLTESPLASYNPSTVDDDAKETGRSVFGQEYRLSTKNNSNQPTQRSSSRSGFIRAYRRVVLCDRFFEEMKICPPPPPLDPDVQAALKRFETIHNLTLPLTLSHLLRRSKLHRYIPHLWYADLVFDNLKYIVLSGDRILLRFLKDCQDCWTGFVLFDRKNPLVDPPVYSETPGIHCTIDFFHVYRKQNQDGTTTLLQERDEDQAAAARVVESQLVLENPRLSNFMEQYAKEAKDWDMDDANSELQEQAEAKFRLRRDGSFSCEEEKEEPDGLRRSKRLKSAPSLFPRLSDLSDNEEVQYEDFGLNQQHSAAAEAKTNSNRQSCPSSSSEVEWKDEE